IIAAASLAGAHEFILELPEGYDTIVGERGSSLSGGQRQRIAIARALVTDPRILIFDEATSALDYESERIIQQNMKAIAKGRTVLVIAHRLSTVRTADRIVTLEGGRLVEDGTHDALIKAGGRYASLHLVQAGIHEIVYPPPARRTDATRHPHSTRARAARRRAGVPAGRAGDRRNATVATSPCDRGHDKPTILCGAGLGLVGYDRHRRIGDGKNRAQRPHQGHPAV